MWTFHVVQNCRGSKLWTEVSLWCKFQRSCVPRRSVANGGERPPVLERAVCREWVVLLPAIPRCGGAERVWEGWCCLRQLGSLPELHVCWSGTGRPAPLATGCCQVRRGLGLLGTQSIWGLPWLTAMSFRFLLLSSHHLLWACEISPCLSQGHG